MADLTFDQSTGAYEISEDAQKRVLEKQMNEASMAQAASLKA
jgi:hypothetical protein